MIPKKYLMIGLTASIGLITSFLTTQENNDQTENQTGS